MLPYTRSGGLIKGLVPLKDVEVLTKSHNISGIVFAIVISW